MLFTKVTIFSVFCFSLHIQNSYGQQTNLLQRYIKQYFKDYFPSTVRSYTLYGNGQNGAADFHASLPYPYEKDGKVKSLIFSTASNPPAAPPKASLSRTHGVVENAWVNDQTNSFSPQTGQFPNQFPGRPYFQQAAQHSRSDTKESDPQPIPKTEQLAESRMVDTNVDDQPEMSRIIISDNDHAEISIQSTMSF